MNRIALLTTVLCIAMLSMSCSDQSGKSLLTQDGSLRTIEVQGHAMLTVEPDVAQMSFDVKMLGSGPREVQEATVAELKKVSAFLVGKGVKADEIKTGRVSVLPIHQHTEADQEKPTHYRGTAQLQINMKDVDQAEALRGDLMLEGMLNILPIVYRVSNMAEHRQEANELAVKAAFENATAMALVVDAKPGEVVSIKVNTGPGKRVADRLPDDDEFMGDGMTPGDDPPADGEPGECTGDNCAPKEKLGPPQGPGHRGGNPDVNPDYLIEAPGTIAIAGSVSVVFTLVE